jgi:hypothetical protein
LEKEIDKFKIEKKGGVDGATHIGIERVLSVGSLGSLTGVLEEKDPIEFTSLHIHGRKVF